MKVWLTLGIAGLSSLGFAQFSDNFESETGSAGGSLLTNGFGGGGQNGWYNPVAGSVDGSVYTYAGNSLGFATNPLGGNQFLGMNVLTAQATNRSQHAVTYGAGVNTLTFDFNAKFAGTPPGADNLGSVSLQPACTNFFQTIYQWGSHLPTADAFDANIGAASSAGGALVFQSPGAAWMNLNLNHWYRQSVTWDFGSNLITSTTLQDLTAGGGVNSFSPTGWYLSGGAGNILGQLTPTDVRFFASGSAGDMMGYDNLNISAVPEPASMAALGLGALALIRKRRKA